MRHLRPALSRTLLSLLLGVIPMTALAETRDPFTDMLATEGSALVPRVSTLMLLAQPENRALRDLLTTVPPNPREFASKHIAVLTTDGVEEIELMASLRYLRDRGAAVDLVSPPKPAVPEQFGVQIPAIRETHILTIRYMENGGWVKFDRRLDQADPRDYDAVIIPGGAWNPDALRADPAALAFVQAIAAKGGVVASLCHGPWVLADAGLLQGKRVTSWGPMRRDLERAGATYVDAPVVIDGQLITSRGPIDLAAFLSAIGEKL